MHFLYLSYICVCVSLCLRNRSGAVKRLSVCVCYIHMCMIIFVVCLPMCSSVFVPICGCVFVFFVSLCVSVCLIFVRNW